MQINKSLLLLSLACLLPNAYSLSMNNNAKPTGGKHTYFEQAQELINNNRAATGTIIGALGLGLAYNFVPAVRTKLDNAVNNVKTKSRNLTKEQQSVISGAKYATVGIALHSSFTYLNKYFDVKKPDATTRTFVANSVIGSLAQISGGIGGLGIKKLYDGLVGYYI